MSTFADLAAVASLASLNYAEHVSAPTAVRCLKLPPNVQQYDSMLKFAKASVVVLTDLMMTTSMLGTTQIDQHRVARAKCCGDRRAAETRESHEHDRQQAFIPLHVSGLCPQTVVRTRSGCRMRRCSTRCCESTATIIVPTCRHFDL